MFDYVKFSHPCKKCGTLLEEWQTKDGPMSLETIELNEINGGLVYTSCDNCNTWNQYKVTTKYAGMIREIPVLVDDKEIYKCSQKMISKVVLQDTADFKDNA